MVDVLQFALSTVGAAALVLSRPFLIGPLSPINRRINSRRNTTI
jgi:hypothetical protein